MRKNTSYEELSKLIIAAIEDEQFFNKEVLVPKVKAILNGFSMNLNQTRYEANRTPSEIAKTIRAKELASLEKKYWRDIVGRLDPENMAKYYDGADKFRIELNVQESDTTDDDSSTKAGNHAPFNKK